MVVRLFVFMRGMLLGIVFLSLLAPALGQNETPQIAISEIHPDPETGGREFIELANLGTQPVNLAGYQIRDAPTTSGNVNAYTFPTWQLPAGARVVVWGGGAATGSGPVWSQSAAWNNAGDVAVLVSPTGAIMDVVPYGAHAYRPPGYENLTAWPKPAKGQSLHLAGGLGVLDEPNPGFAPGAVGGSLELQVANLAPRVHVDDAPSWVRPGTPVAITWTPGDGNGDADVASWVIRGPHVLTSGTSGGMRTDVLRAPTSLGPWPLQFAVTDRQGLAASANLTILVKLGPLRVDVMPQAGVLPDLTADAPWVESGVVARIHNDAADPVAPRLDVAPFGGPVVVDPAGIMEIGWRVAGETMWIAYHGPLTALPELAGGGDAELLVRFHAGAPLPAGRYGTTFSVVAT